MSRLYIDIGAAFLLTGMAASLHAEVGLRGNEAATADIKIKGVIISPPPCTQGNYSAKLIDFFRHS